MPAYNEAANIRAGVLSRVVEFLEGCGTTFEILIVDDGSADESVELVRAIGAAEPLLRLIQTHHGGKAHALVTGLRAARGRIVLFSDIDQAIPIAEASKLFPWFDRGFDIVVGSRGLKRRHAAPSRRAISFGQLAARVALLGFGDITDTQCGFKAFRGEVVMPLIDRLVVYAGAADQRAAGPRLSPGFDVELLYVARKMKCSIKEVAVEVDHRRRGPKTSLVRDCIRGVADLMAIRAADRKGRYG
jgi:glycosyltransferase involved in cell wall biosynthesis